MTFLQVLDPSSLDALDLRAAIGLQRVLVPEQYGAVGDGIADDTAAIAALFSAAVSGSTVFSPAGKTYLVDAVTVPNKRLFLDFNGSGFKKKAAATEARFLVAPANWVNSSPSAALPITLRDVTFDGNGQCSEAVLILNNYFTTVDGVSVSGGSNHGLEWTCQGADGATIVASTMVNNKIVRSRFFSNGGSGIKTIDPNRNRLTDLKISNACESYSNTGWAADIASSAGIEVNGLQTYGNALGGVYHRAWGQGARHVSCYHDDIGPGVRVDELFTAGTVEACVFKNCYLYVTFGAGSQKQTFYSVGNTYYNASGFAGIQHGFFGSGKVIYSSADSFDTPDGTPCLQWHNGSSTGLIFCQGSHSRNLGTGRVLQGYQRVASSAYRPVTRELGTAIPVFANNNGPSDYDIGSEVVNTNRASGQPVNWVCTARSTPGNVGTWIAGPSYP